MANILGNRIRALRQEKGLNQRDLSDKLNVSNTTLSQYETGQRVPSDDIKLKIAKFFDVTIDYLLGASNNRGATKKNIPHASDQEDQVIQRALKDSDLLEPDGRLSEKGEKVISDFITNNADLLRKLIKDK